MYADKCIADEGIKFSVVVQAGNKMDQVIKQHSSKADEKHIKCYVLCSFSTAVQYKIVNQYFWDCKSSNVSNIMALKFLCSIRTFVCLPEELSKPILFITNYHKDSCYYNIYAAIR